MPTILTNVALLAAGVASSVIASRALGPAGRGEYVSWQAWGAAGGILALGGVPQALVLERHRRRFSRAEIALILAATCACALPVIIVATIALRPGVAATVGLALVIVATQMGALSVAQAQHLGRMVTEFNLARLIPTLALFGALLALFVGDSSSSTAWLLTIAVAQTGFTTVWLVHHTRRGRERGDIGGLLRRAFVIAPANWLTLLQYRLDVLAVAVLYPPSIVSYYAIGVAAQSAVLAVGQSTGMHWFTGQPGTLRRLWSELVFTAVIALAVAVPLAASATGWIGAAYGAPFTPAAPLVAILCLVGVAQSMDYLLTHDSLMRGRPARTAVCRLPSVIVLLTGFLVARRLDWPVAIVALLPGIGYVLSAVTFAMVLYLAGRSSIAQPITGDPECRGDEDVSSEPGHAQDQRSLLPHNER
jgi:O-antigen/teichoic acid export membrane protein